MIVLALFVTIKYFSSFFNKTDSELLMYFCFPSTLHTALSFPFVSFFNVKIRVCAFQVSLMLFHLLILEYQIRENQALPDMHKVSSMR